MFPITLRFPGFRSIRARGLLHLVAAGLSLGLSLPGAAQAGSDMFTRPVLPRPIPLPQPAACPDLAVSLRVVGLRERPGAPAMVIYEARVRNVGNADYVSGANQQGLYIFRFDNRRPVVRRQFGTLRQGQSVILRAEVPYLGVEFGGARAEVRFDPDILYDGNPRNDECNPRNNRADVTTAQENAQLAAIARARGLRLPADVRIRPGVKLPPGTIMPDIAR